MLWLFVTSEPWPMHNGTALRVYHLARELVGRGDSVHLLTDRPDDGFAREYGRFGTETTITGVPGALQKRRWRFSPYPANVALSDGLQARSAGFDAVVLFGAAMLQHAIASHARRTVAEIIDDPILANRRSLWHGRPRMWLRRLRLLAELRLYERRHLPHVAAAFFVSDADAESFRRRNPRTAVAVVPNGVDLHVTETECGAEDAGPDNVVVLVGNYAFLPNITAADVLVHKVAPLVWSELPQTRFRLVGPNLPSSFVAGLDERVEAVGFVDEVWPHLRGATAVAAPMSMGTGIKNKILEAWAASRPVVATSLACQGLPARDGNNVLLGDTPAELAHAIIRLCEDRKLCHAIGAAGRLAVETGFSWPAVAERFRQSCLLVLEEKRRGNPAWR